MTANRWWVKTIARWLARVDGVKGHIQVVSLGVTAFSTFSLVLQNSGHGNLVVPLGVVGLIAMPIYTYLYTEGGVWNQVSRDRRDLSNNFAGPNARISNEMLARGLAAYDKGERLNEREKELIQEELDETFYELRNGLEIEE